MRILCLAASAAALTVTAAAADPYGSPRVIYAIPPVTIVVPPTGYVLDPSDAVNPVYVVNQGPVLSGPGIYTYSNTYYSTFARPTYSEGGYAYTDPIYYRWSAPYPYPYPYVNGHHGWRCGHFGCRSGYYAGRRFGYRPYGHPPYAAYRNQPAPTARVIHLPSRGH